MAASHHASNMLHARTKWVVGYNCTLMQIRGCSEMCGEKPVHDCSNLNRGVVIFPLQDSLIASILQAGKGKSNGMSVSSRPAT
jgi:hypothetical protein